MEKLDGLYLKNVIKENSKRKILENIFQSLQRKYKTKLDDIIYFNKDPIAVYYFTKGFIAGCEDLEICKEGKIKIGNVLEYLGYRRILIKMFRAKNINSINTNYEYYKNLGEEYAELYFKNKYIRNITENHVAEIINGFLNSKLSYGLFSNGYFYNIKDKSIQYII